MTKIDGLAAWRSANHRAKVGWAEVERLRLVLETIAHQECGDLTPEEVAFRALYAKEEN